MENGETQRARAPAVHHFTGENSAFLRRIKQPRAHQKSMGQNAIFKCSHTLSFTGAKTPTHAD